MKILYLLIPVAFCAILNLSAADIGSDASPNRFANNVTLFNGDRVASFAALEGGFQLFSSGSHVIFDSFMNVSGPINLFTGTLELHRDLIIRNEAEIQTLGDIIGHSHLIDLAPTITCIPTQGAAANHCDAILINEEGELQPDDVLTLDWSYDSQYIAIGLNDNGGVDQVLRIYRWDGSTLTLLVDEFLTVFEAVTIVRWHPTNYLFAIVRDQRTGGSNPPEVRIFSFDPYLETITPISGLNLSSNARSCAWHPSGNYLAVARDHAQGPTDGVVPEIAIYAVDEYGVINPTPVDEAALKNVIVAPANRLVSPHAFDWNAAGDYLAVGTTAESSYPELFIFHFNGSSITNKTTPETFTFGSKVNAVDWNLVHTDLLGVGTNGSNPIRLMKHIPGSAIIQEFQDNPIMGNPKPLVADWGPSGSCLAFGWTNGDLRLYTLDSDYLTLDLSGNNVTDPPTGNEIETVRWAPGGLYLAIGSKNNRFYVYGTRSVLETCLSFTDVNFRLNCNLIFKECCIKFSGQSSFNGRGKCLTFDGCEIIIDDASQLLFKDITLKGISRTTIHGLTDSSVLALSDVQWVQDDDYTFTVGSLDIRKNVEIIGDGTTFAYQTDQVSTINACASLILDHGVTFSYDPSIASKELLSFADDTSQLILNGATLHSTATGMQLTKGKLIIDRDSFLSAEGTTASNALLFGDGYDYTNNLCIQLFPAANLTITQGTVLYNNV